MIVHELFPTTVMEFDLNPHVDTKLLWNELKDLKMEEHSLLTDGGSSTYFPGNSHLLDVSNPLIQKLRTQIEKCLDEYTTTVGLISTTISNSWLSVMNKDTELLPHRHEASVLSGAYYPKVPQGSVGLTVLNPLKPYTMCMTNQKTTRLNAEHATVPAREGVLYIFPSWLEHRSEPNQSDSRAVISFNTLNNAITDNYKKQRLL